MPAGLAGRVTPETACVDRQFFRPASVEAEKIGSFGGTVVCGCFFSSLTAAGLRCEPMPAPAASPTPLPIDAVIPEIVARVTAEHALVLEAPPGAGKTTRVPWALHAAGDGRGEIIVTEPRRLAARMAARRVASERSVKL